MSLLVVFLTIFVGGVVCAFFVWGIAERDQRRRRAFFRRLNSRRVRDGHEDVSDDDGGANALRIDSPLLHSRSRRHLHQAPSPTIQPARGVPPLPRRFFSPLHGHRRDYPLHARLDPETGFVDRRNISQDSTDAMDRMNPDEISILRIVNHLQYSPPTRRVGGGYRDLPSLITIEELEEDFPGIFQQWRELWNPSWVNSPQEAFRLEHQLKRFFPHDPYVATKYAWERFFYLCRKAFGARQYLYSPTLTKGYQRNGSTMIKNLDQYVVYYDSELRILCLGRRGRSVWRKLTVGPRFRNAKFFVPCLLSVENVDELVYCLHARRCCGTRALTAMARCFVTFDACGQTGGRSLPEVCADVVSLCGHCSLGKTLDSIVTPLRFRVRLTPPLTKMQFDLHTLPRNSLGLRRYAAVSVEETSGMIQIAILDDNSSRIVSAFANFCVQELRVHVMTIDRGELNSEWGLQLVQDFRTIVTASGRALEVQMLPTKRPRGNAMVEAVHPACRAEELSYEKFGIDAGGALPQIMTDLNEKERYCTGIAPSECFPRFLYLQGSLEEQLLALRTYLRMTRVYEKCCNEVQGKHRRKSKTGLRLVHSGMIFSLKENAYVFRKARIRMEKSRRNPHPTLMVIKNVVGAHDTVSIALNDLRVGERTILAMGSSTDVRTSEMGFVKNLHRRIGFSVSEVCPDMLPFVRSPQLLRQYGPFRSEFSRKDRVLIEVNGVVVARAQVVGFLSEIGRYIVDFVHLTPSHLSAIPIFAAHRESWERLYVILPSTQSFVDSEPFNYTFPMERVNAYDSVEWERAKSLQLMEHQYVRYLKTPPDQRVRLAMNWNRNGM